jgi:hypothetical protein
VNAGCFSHAGIMTDFMDYVGLPSEELVGNGWKQKPGMNPVFVF